MHRVLVSAAVFAVGYVHALTLSNSASSQGSFAAEMGLLESNVIFERPTFGLLVVVDGEGPLLEEEWTPFLRTLNKFNTPVGVSSVQQVVDEENKAEKARNFLGENFALTTSSGEDDNVQKYWTHGGKQGIEEFLTNTQVKGGKHMVVLKDEASSSRLQAELALMDRVVRDLLVGAKSSSNRQKPILVYSEVYGLLNRNSPLRSKSFSELSTQLESVMSLLKKQTSRPLFTVVFTGKKQGPAPTLVTELQVQESRRLQSTTKRIPFQGSDYVIMFWTLVSLMILTFFVICCIPWSPTLDPALRSTLKQDTKRD